MKIGKTRSLMLTCFVVALLLLTGCASSLVRDLQDCVSVSVGTGSATDKDGNKTSVPALAADIQIGFITHPSLATTLSTDSINYGWRDGDFRGEMNEFGMFEPWITFVEPPYFPIGSYLVLEQSKNINHSNHDSINQIIKFIKKDMYNGDTRFDESLYMKAGLWWPIPIFPEDNDVKMPFSLCELTNINAGVHLGYVTLRAGVNPLEFVELVFSLFGQGWDKRDRE
jgi:hypothetical protein